MSNYEIFLFIIVLMTIISFNDCSNEKRLGYESSNSTIEYESIPDREDSDTVVAAEPYDYCLVNITASEKASNNQSLSNLF